MNQIILKVNELYETSGYQSVIDFYQNWKNPNNELNDWDEIALRLHVAKLALANKDKEFLTSIINVGFLSSEKKELIELRERISTQIEKINKSSCAYFEDDGISENCKYLMNPDAERLWCKRNGDWCCSHPKI